MEYITIDDGIVSGHFDAVSVPANGVPVDQFSGGVGLPVTHFNEGWILKSSEELLASGIIEDHRGVYYTKAEGSSIVIDQLIPAVPDELTATPPTTEFDTFDEGTGAWVTDEELQTAVTKQRAIASAQDSVNKKLAKTLDLTIQFLEEKFIMTTAQQSFLDGATTVEDIKTVLNTHLTMTPAQLQIVSDFHIDYQAWLDSQA